MNDKRHGVLTPQGEDFPRWYQDVVAKAKLADNGPVRGTMVIRPHGYAIWERIQTEIDERIKRCGAQNAYFPLLIPESYLRREAEHVEGFSPELAVVTHGGGKELEEPAVVRPTSETIINSYFSKWVQSWRDLPLCINQWANVVRWELRPRLFLRTSEFLWQEGHTAHATEAEARAYALRILHEVYESVMTDVLAIPVLVGRKTERERFAGATTTWTCEGAMRDSKALQMGTSHELGQNFARAFDITFSDETGDEAHVWQTSWGVSTRLMGALVMAHGDDAGLRVPPKVAPVQVAVVLVRGHAEAGERAAALAAELADTGLRVELDDRTDTSFGRRAVDWELKGVPVRIEVGPREMVEGNVVVVRRDSREKQAVPISGIAARVVAMLDNVQVSLLTQAETWRRSITAEVSSLEECIHQARQGFATLPATMLGEEGEAVLAAAGVSVRCLQRPDGGLPSEHRDEDLVAVVARTY